jgi:hypothetical protein
MDTKPVVSDWPNPSRTGAPVFSCSRWMVGGRVETGDVLEARQPAPLLLGGVEHGGQHGREVGEMRDLVAVDEPHRLLAVEARHHHAGAAGMEDGEAPAQRRDVEETAGATR